MHFAYTLLLLNTQGSFMKSIKLLAATAALTVSSIAVAGPNYTYLDLGFVTADSSYKKDTGGFVLRGSFGEDLFHVGAEIAAGEANGGKGSKPIRAAEEGGGSITGTDTSGYKLYFGINPAVTDNIDLIVRVGYRADDFKGDCLDSSCYIDELSPFFVYSDDRQIEGGNYKIEQEAVFLELGTRALITEKFELNSYVTYSNGNTKIDQPLIEPGQSNRDSFAQWAYRVGGEYYFTEMFSAGVGLRMVTARENFTESETEDVAEGSIHVRVNF